MTVSVRLPNIILIGLPGCGKTTVGKKLSKTANLRFLDTDLCIETQNNCTVSRLFELHGQEHFRNLETALIQSLYRNNESGTVISTGGGMPMRPQNAALLKQLGFIVWLQVAPADLYKRIAKFTHRPLLQQENPQQVLADLHRRRSPVYQTLADLTIDTANLHPDEICFGILESARVFFAAQR